MTNVIKAEKGTLFVHGDEGTYPPEYTFVVMSLLPDVPVHYDRKHNMWWTAIADEHAADIYARNDLYHDKGDDPIYWKPIEFKKL